MSLTTAKQAASNGVFEEAVLNTLRNAGYSDAMLEAIYGYSPDGQADAGDPQGDGMNEAYFNAAMRSIATRLQSNNSLETLSDAVNDIWPRMSATQRAQLQQLLERYGIAYEE